jgi:hypothetical protein
MDNNFNNVGSEKKIRHLIHLSSKKVYKEIFPDIDKINNLPKKVSRSNHDLIHINLKKILSEEKNQLNNSNDKKTSFFLLNSVNNESKYIIKEKNKSHSNDNKYNNKFKEEENNTNNSDSNKNQTKIIRSIGKKVKNFLKQFERENISLTDNFQIFKNKVLEVHNKFKIFSKNLDNSNNNSLKIKNIHFINFNEIYIYERKIIEFLEKQSSLYNKIIIALESIFSEDNLLNFDCLRDLYMEMETDSINFIKYNNIKDEPLDINFTKFKTKGRYSFDMYNLNTFSIQNEDLEIKKKSEKKNLHRLFLPALREKNIIIDSNNNLNSDTFRNTSHTRILKSVNERIKQFELFKPGRNSITTTMKKSINNMPVINTKLIDKYCETNKSIKILNLEKEFEALPKQIKTERPENKFNILINKDKIKDLLKSKKLKVPINLKQGKITMKNMLNKNEETNQEISNVNDYIMNYSSIKRFSSDKSNNRIKIKLDKNFEKNNETNINKENNYSQTIKIGEKKLMIKKTENDSYYPRDKEKNSSKIQDNIINEYKENVNNNISSSDNNSIEENNDRNNKNERKTTSERSRSKFSSEKSDSGSEIIKKIVSENESFEKKDPLDDIEYLKKFRQENEKENLKRFEHLLSDDDDNEEDIKENEENKEKRKSISTSKRESKFKSVNKFDFLY